MAMYDIRPGSRQAIGSAPPVPPKLARDSGVDADPTVDIHIPRIRQRPAIPSASQPRTEDTPPTLSADKPKSSEHRNRVIRVFAGYWRRKLWALPLTILVILGVIAVVPQTRYPILALGLKRSFSITVMDSKTGTPVSGAHVILGGQSVTTGGSGTATITVPVGPRSLSISKQYYQTATESVFVGIGTKHNAASIQLVATGRQVPVKVVNAITGAVITDAVITVLDTNANTDNNGQATIVLPTSATMQAATISANGFNDLTANIQVTDQVVAGNTFAISPAGRVYFLSNLSGKIDVVSTNLDGNGRRTILVGTGREDGNTTVLLASRDWKFLALLSKRDGGDYAKLFLINTDSGQLTTFDSSQATLTPVGWADHTFVYKSNPATVQNWQPGTALLESYNADTGKQQTLFTSGATGTNSTDAIYENVWDVVLMGDTLVYDTTWYATSGGPALSSQQQNILASVGVDGSNNKTIKSVDASQYYFSNLKLANPSTAYLGIYATSTNAANYYRLDTSGNLTQGSTITSDTVNQTYPTYLQSPSGNATFWTEQRDGKNSLFTGDAAGGSAQQIASLSGYSPYGWFTDDYLLVQKNNSELYIMSKSGGTPVKLSDYFKSASFFDGSGGSYGGL